MQCPVCSSENVRRLSAVWEEGSYSEETVSRTSTKGRSNVWAGGGWGSVQSRQSGTTRSTTSGTSALADRARPPKRDSPFMMAAEALIVGVPAIFIGGVIIAVATSDPVAFTVMGIASVLLLLFIVKRIQGGLAFNRGEYPGLRATWERSWWCSKCGEIYTQD